MNNQNEQTEQNNHMQEYVDNLSTCMIGFKSVINFDDSENWSANLKCEGPWEDFVDLVGDSKYTEASALLRKSNLAVEDWSNWFRTLILLSESYIASSLGEEPVYKGEEADSDILQTCLERWSKFLTTDHKYTGAGAALVMVRDYLNAKGMEFIMESLSERFSSYYEAEDTILEYCEQADEPLRHTGSGMALTRYWDLDPLFPWRDITLQNENSGVETTLRVYGDPVRVYGDTNTPTHLIPMIEKFFEQKNGVNLNT
jgi:hypothetical protein